MLNQQQLCIKHIYRKPYSVAVGKTDDALVAAKEELSKGYNFDDWKKENLST